MNNKRIAGVFACFGFLMAAVNTHADVVFGFSQGDLDATATFVATGDTLMVTLQNTASVDVAVPGDVLTGVFFDIDGFVGSLTRASAILTDLSGTPVLFGAGLGETGLGYHAGGDVGSEAGYRTGAFAEGGVGDHAIGQVGMDDFLGETTRFDLDDCRNLQGPLSLNGIEYGFVNSGYAGGGNPPLDGPAALITTGVKYTFTGFSGFSEGDIGNVWFNYGTEFNPIPAPSAALLAMIGAPMIGWVKRRFA